MTSKSELILKAKQNKYKNKKESRIINKTITWFDSKKEAKRFDELYLLLKAKKIEELILQPKYLLMDTQRHGNITYPKVTWSGDFKYKQNGKIIVEDVKSDATAKDKTYRVKIKWFLSLYGKDIEFREI